MIQPARHWKAYPLALCALASTFALAGSPALARERPYLMAALGDSITAATFAEIPGPTAASRRGPSSGPHLEPSADPGARRPADQRSHHGAGPELRARSHADPSLLPIPASLEGRLGVSQAPGGGELDERRPTLGGERRCP